MLREIIRIDEKLCDGCGKCVPSCHEGALQVIDGKVRLISDLFCDGLGACLGECPQNALTIEKREAEPYDEEVVMETIVKGGINVIKAHLEHLYEHDEKDFLGIAISYLENNGIDVPEFVPTHPAVKCGCPGSAEKTLEVKNNFDSEVNRQTPRLKQWPIQLHLVSPNAGYYKNSDLLLASDCSGFASANFHNDFLKDKSVAIACPKLDSNKQNYIEKLTAMIDYANLQSITVLIMQVPCCGGLVQIAQQALQNSSRDIPIKVIVLGIDGEILNTVDVN
ncbi:MAG: 4Fe-4S binding protein [Melioribacteraceae bacterium]|nr:4Fe-4S binding protein [Melioribacteraceae bacterium]